MTERLNTKLFLHLLDTKRDEFYKQSDNCFARAGNEPTPEQKWVWNAKGESYKDAGRQMFVLAGLLRRE